MYSEITLKILHTSNQGIKQPLIRLVGKVMDKEPTPGIPRNNRITFPYQLHSMLAQAEMHGFANIISWQPSGESFVISQPHKFTEEILPRFFRQTKFSSFKRQLNAYGFQREQSDLPEVLVYSNKPNFTRDSPEACDRIRRRRVIQDTDAMTLVEARQSAFATSQSERHPSFMSVTSRDDSSDAVDSEAQRRNALLINQLEMHTSFPPFRMADDAASFHEADISLAMPQQVPIQSTTHAACEPDMRMILNQSDPVLDDLADSLAISGEEYNLGEWDVNKEECESP